jgi:hypothetical protein
MTRWILLGAAASSILMAPGVHAAGEGPAIPEKIVAATVDRLVSAHGAEHAEAIRRGVSQVAERWWPEDGDAEAFESFCVEEFVSDPQRRAATFERLQAVLEQIDGHLHEVRRELRRPQDLDLGPVLPIDRKLAGLDLGAHVNADLFQTKVAFVALLNFPVHTLEQRLDAGAEWSRERWARSRMMDRFATRIPAGVGQGISAAISDAAAYVAGYNIRMDRLVAAAGERPFPDGLRLISHWGLRDEIKAQYAREGGLQRQRIIVRVMSRIVKQEIPIEVIDNPDLYWCPETNQVGPTPRPGGEAEPEADRRYRKILEVFHAQRAADPHVPTAPTFIERQYELQRQIPEREVVALLETVLRSPEARRAAKLIRQRLGRPLEPFDIWYPGFASRGTHDPAELDRLVRSRFADAKSFDAELPTILGALGFSEERSRWLAERIVVDPARGAGHAMGAVRRGDEAHLRTRFGPQGMDYKGFNIAIHELGHNVEQVFSLDGIDHWFLSGVPAPGFTEAIAFVFQNRDLEVLGLEAPEAASSLRALDTLWSVIEIGAVSLVELRTWHWLYEHPEATPVQLRDAQLRIAREVWAEYLEPLLGPSSGELLAIYSHQLSYPLYLSNYAIGHLIAFQVAGHLEQSDRPFGAEIERITRIGKLTPDAWMRAAVDSPLSAEPLLAAAREALDGLD